jgi:hypothetical protein
LNMLQAMKKRLPLIILILLLTLLLTGTSCKSAFTRTAGSFSILNNSELPIEFIWIAPRGEFYPTAKSIFIPTGGTYEIQGINEGTYDIAIDFRDSLNSINSKKDPNLNLVISRGLTTYWRIEPDGRIIIQ